MDSSLEELKSRLRSLVVSSPAQVDAGGLARDYRLMMGEHLPTARYGYRDPVAFLREKCSDCFLFSGPHANPVLTLIVPDTLKHIDGFVQKQKISSSAKFKGKRRSVPESMVRQQEGRYRPSNGTASKNHTSTYKPPVSHYPPPGAKSKAPTTTYTYKPPDTRNEHSVPVTESNHNKQRLQETKSENAIRQSMNNLHIQREESDCNNSLASTGTSQTAVQIFLQKRLHNSSQYIEPEMRDDDSGRQTLSSGGLSSKQALLDDLRLEMKVLIAEHPDGIWSADLMRLYKARFGRELPLARVGYSNVVSLTRALAGVLRVARPERTGDWLLLDARAADPPPPTARAAAAAVAAAPADPPADPDDALPGVPFEASVFPADCLHFVESIPLGTLPTAGEAGEAALCVMVGEVYSPSHLWLLRLGAAHHAAMERVMDEMNEYYGRGDGRERALEAGAVRVGHYCAAPFEGDWHRALIVRVLDSDTVKVRYVDYGTVARVAAAALRPLRRGWARLPAQALRARLAGVRPVAGGRRWPHAAARRLLQLVQQRRLVAQLVAVDPEERILEVFLIDTSGAEDVCINDALVAAGHADPRADSALASSETHLFPAFAALEGGATPNLADIERYLAAGLQPRYVSDYRRHVPPDTPPAPAAPAAPAAAAEPRVWLPLLELEVFRALAAQPGGAGVAARHLAASLARAPTAPAPAAAAPALALHALDAEVLARLCEAPGGGGGLTALRFLDALLPPAGPAAPAAPAPALDPRAPEFPSIKY